MKISRKEYKQTKITDSNFEIKKCVRRPFLENKNDKIFKNFTQSKPQNSNHLNGFLGKKAKRNSKQLEKLNIEASQAELKFDTFEMINFSISQNHLVLIKEIYNLSKKKKIFFKIEELQTFQNRQKIEIKYLNDLKEFLESKKLNEFMLRNFPESYTIQNFYENLEKTKKKNFHFTRNLPEPGICFTPFKSHYNHQVYFPLFKKIWSPLGLNNYQISFYIVLIKKFWYYECLEWSYEGALEFLMVNRFDVMKTVKLVRRYDRSFEFLMEKYSRKNTLTFHK